MIAALRHFDNHYIFDRYFTVEILPIDLRWKEDVGAAIEQVRAEIRKNPIGLVRIFDSTFEAGLLPRVERALIRYYPNATRLYV